MTEKYNSTLAESTLTVNELKEAFFPLNINKSPGYDDINVVRNCFGSLLKPLMAIFNLSLQKGCFLEELKLLELQEYIRGNNV